MLVYLPIAEISINAFALIGVGAFVGFLSGMFGVGGGFLLTPILIFMGVPPSVAASTSASQVAASSVSGALTQARRKAVDERMGLVLFIGGFFGTIVGVQLFALLKILGQIDVFIPLIYVVLLSSIGGLMLAESIAAIRQRRQAIGGTGSIARMAPAIPVGAHLPWKMLFPRSKLEISIIPPLLLSFGVGILSAVMGVGGGFIMVPAMIYLLRMPANLVVGTSLLQVLCVSCWVTLLQSAQNHTVDLVLAACLLSGGAIGAPLGLRVGQRLKADELRALLALLVLAMGLKLFIDAVGQPAELFILRSLHE